MADVFVSYKAEDRGRIRPLVQALQADGYSVWWDEQIDGGTAWRHAIEAELNLAKCVIVAWSKHSAGPSGSFVQDEATRAQERHVYVPITIDTVHLPLGFGETQALPMVGWRGDRADRRYCALLAAVHRNVGGQRASVPFSRESRVGRRALMVAGGFVITAIAGIGGLTLLHRGGVNEPAGSIAVLPFDNLSGDPSQSYFSDGMAEELRSALTRIPDLKVVARTSSEAVRNDDVKTAALRLGVANILIGSVRRSATTIRVNAQLVDGRTGLERWSEEFDQPIGDTLSIQSSIAERVADALRIQLGETVRAALTLGGTRNAAAQDLFLKASRRRGSETPESLQRSIADLDAAIQLDPNYAQAYASKASVLALYGADWARSSSELSEELNDAAETARRAIAIAPRLAQAHAALGFTYKVGLKFKEALREMQMATALPGADAGIQASYANLLAEIGRTREAQDTVKRAVSLDPLNPGTYQQEALIFYLSHDFPDAVAAAHHSLELNPSGTFARVILANSFVIMGHFDEANAEFAKLPPDSALGLTGEAIVGARTKNAGAFNKAVKRLREVFGDSANYEFAEIYAQSDDVNAAIRYLTAPVAQRDPGFIFIIGDPFLDPIRGDPRFKKIIQNLDFPVPS